MDSLISSSLDEINSRRRVFSAIRQRGEARLEDRVLLSARRQLRRTVRMSSGSFGLSARERRVLQRLALARNVDG
ncbi:hypothetical protein LWI28_024891 [Acer negundo]|uniref:Uncharacterized protein n=1 Tax=Acer negundo TaxID=4023 RepID=A0AAD5NIX2_ACENE|nr:hypothetical protein LWI28_024891 [Acer negundo]